MYYTLIPKPKTNVSVSTAHRFLSYSAVQSFEQDEKYRKAAASARALEEYRTQLDDHGRMGMANRAFRVCEDMKRSGIEPNVTCYNLVLLACAKKNLGKEALVLLYDMEQMRIKPTVETYNHIFAVCFHFEFFTPD